MIDSLLTYLSLSIVAAMFVGLLFTGFAIALEYNVNPLSSFLTGVTVL